MLAAREGLKKNLSEIIDMKWNAVWPTITLASVSCMVWIDFELSAYVFNLKYIYISLRWMLHVSFN